eukprot:scaffold772_cov339-Pavlova_lutheri.AAC.54
MLDHGHCPLQSRWYGVDPGLCAWMQHMLEREEDRSEQCEEPHERQQCGIEQRAALQSVRHFGVEHQEKNRTGQCCVYGEEDELLGSTEGGDH